MGKLPLDRLGALSLSKRLQMEFLPRNADLGLLILRVDLAVPMIVGYGWGKRMSGRA